MDRISDETLIREIGSRLDEHRRALHDLDVLTRKLDLMNRKLQEAEGLKTHFLSNLRNEINNPLTAIVGLSRQLLTASGPSREEMKKTLGMIHAEASYLGYQLENMMTAAELEAGEAAPAYAVVDVRGLIGSCTDLFSDRLEAKRISFHLAPDAISRGEKGERIELTTDAGKLRTILVNLLANAVEYGPEGSRVTARATLTDGWLEISVEDEGPGLPPDTGEEAFGHFRQHETGTTKAHKGQGLGLSVARSLVELLGGRMTLETGPAGGCLSRLFLPPAPEAGNAIAEDGNLFLFDEAERF